MTAGKDILTTAVEPKAATLTAEYGLVELNAGETVDLKASVWSQHGNVDITATTVTTNANATLTAGNNVDIDATGNVTLGNTVTGAKKVEIDGADITAVALVATDKTVKVNATGKSSTMTIRSLTTARTTL